MAVLRPALDRVREKLYVASLRQTTRGDDTALGIFNTPIPAMYGEGNRAFGRLLGHILTGSGDVAILAWTGCAGSYNSCLPVDLRVYLQLVTLHVLQPIETAKMDRIVTQLRSSLPLLSLVVRLHKRFNAFPLPSISPSRLRLPNIFFHLTIPQVQIRQRTSMYIMRRRPHLRA